MSANFDTKPTHLPSRTSMAGESKEAAPVPAASRTFFLRAEADYEACSIIIASYKLMFDGASSFLYPSNREHMLRVLRQRIAEARISGYDDGLCVAYETVGAMMQSWYFANDLRNIINSTLGDLRRGALRPHLLSAAPLVRENIALRETIQTQATQAQEAEARHQAELEKKTQEIISKDKRIDKLMTELTDARKDLTDTRKELREAVDKINLLINFQKPSGPSSEGESRGNSRAN